MAWVGLTDRWCCLIWIWSCCASFPVCGFVQRYCGRFWCPPRSLSCWEFHVRWKSPGITQQEGSKSWRRQNFCPWNSPVAQPRCRWNPVPRKQLDKRMGTREERKESLKRMSVVFRALWWVPAGSQKMNPMQPTDTRQIPLTTQLFRDEKSLFWRK